MKYILYLVFLILSGNLLAQPHLTGTVYVDMESGLIKCKLILENLPSIENYRLVLHRGMNIKHFKDMQNELVPYSGHFNGEFNGEGINYFFTGENGMVSLPNQIKIEYLGAFPVYDKDYNTFDFKGFIANNGKTFRAAEQTKWYPVIYDIENDVLYEKYTYDIIVNLKNGSSIYINGCRPVSSNSGRFISEKPLPILMFLGEYSINEYKSNFILNDSISRKDVKLVLKNIDRIKLILEKIVGEKFSDPITLIAHDPVNKRPVGSQWGFNTYPTFAFTGISFSEIVDSLENFSVNNYRFFGHELSHNYFGSNVFSGDLKWFWLESIPEYLSFRVDKAINGSESHHSRLLQRMNFINSEDKIPLSGILNAEDIDENYRYNIGPLILKCIEDRIGLNKMDIVISELYKLSLKKQLTLNDLERVILKSGVSKEIYDEMYSLYFNDPKFVENIKTKIKIICR